MAYCKTFLGAAALSLVLSLPTFAQETAMEPATADTVVAVVGEVEVTVGHLIAMRLSLTEQQQQLPDQVIFEGLLERVIQQRAISQSVETLDKKTTLMLENERSALISSEQVAALADTIEVTEAELQAAYDEQFAEFVPLKEYNSSHILVATEEEALEIISELEAGADFAEMARLKSTGPSGVNGGELGWQGPGRLVPPFEEAALALEPGQISAPVQTQFGWHIIKLNDTRLPEAPSLESVSGELENAIWERKLRAEIAAMVEAADVERPDVSRIDPAILKDVSLIEN